MRDYLEAALPWSWAQKTADFQKPGGAVLILPADLPARQSLAAVPDESFDLVLNQGALCAFEEFQAVRRVLKPDGFFLSEQPGGEDCRRLANFLCPGSRPAGGANLETLLPQLQRAGFRVMYRDQAYPMGKFLSLRALADFIAHAPERFPNITEKELHAHREALESMLKRDGGIPNEEHVILLIGKKQ